MRSQYSEIIAELIPVAEQIARYNGTVNCKDIEHYLAQTGRSIPPNALGNVFKSDKFCKLYRDSRKNNIWIYELYKAPAPRIEWRGIPEFKFGV